MLLGCHPPVGVDGRAHTNDLCWADEQTLIIVQYLGSQVYKLTIDLEKGKCKIDVLDRGAKARRVTCAPNGDIYVSFPLNGTIKIYHRYEEKDRWENITNVAVPRNVAVSQSLIVVDHNGSTPFAVFNAEREFMETVSVSAEKHEVLYTHLTDEGTLIATGHFSHELYIHNMSSNSTVTVAGRGKADGMLESPGDLCDAPGGYILVCDWQNHRISVFDRDGKFVNHLEFDHGTLPNPNGIAVIARRNKPPLMAVAPFPDAVLYIYELK